MFLSPASWLLLLDEKCRFLFNTLDAAHSRCLFVKTPLLQYSKKTTRIVNLLILLWSTALRKIPSVQFYKQEITQCSWLEHSTPYSRCIHQTGISINQSRERDENTLFPASKVVFNNTGEILFFILVVVVVVLDHHSKLFRKGKGENAYARSPRMRRASWMSLGMMVTRLAWMAAKLVSSNKPTK